MHFPVATSLAVLNSCLLAANPVGACKYFLLIWRAMAALLCFSSIAVGPHHFAVVEHSSTNSDHSLKLGLRKTFLHLQSLSH